MKNYVVITGDGCKWCDKAKELIANNGDSYVEVDILDAVEIMSALGAKTVPQVLLAIGGYEDLARES